MINIVDGNVEIHARLQFFWGALGGLLNKKEIGRFFEKKIKFKFKMKVECYRKCLERKLKKLD